MIDFACPSCGEQLSAPDDFTNKRIRCGGCQGVAVVPAVSEAVTPEPPRARPRRDDRDEPSRYDAYRGEPSRGRRDRDEDEDRGRRGRRDREDEDDYGVRRRPIRRVRRGEWADCPNCGAPDPVKVSYTWWGGFIGPAIINTVRCQECGTQYNGIHGDYNTTRIIIHTFVGLGIGVAFAVCLGVINLL